jgi:predicted TIM-barrel fold metal-dependent hydrolase
MMDSYAHLDMSVPNPLGDLRSRMASASVKCALVVETWGKDNAAILEHLAEVAQSEFRIALCYRPAEGLPVPLLFEQSPVVALRVKTADLKCLNETAAYLEATGKWLLPHAESGIGALAKELISLAAWHPRLRIYLPHLGWPRRDEHDDPQWREVIAELSLLPNIVAGISAIAHFSKEAFPHADIEPLAAYLVETFGPHSVVIGSDYPLFKKEDYGRYIELAQRWVFGAGLGTESESESVLFAAPAS